MGNRYGAEPDPALSPQDAVCRYYTQLEYDAGRGLNKQVYTLICEDDFPIDSRDAESDLKVLLQKTHRETLIGHGVKYERVATPRDK